jgi:hypothetical protein|tara:strand:- start:2193 stop:2414 length:222 start_codon:yes stop_codon:yes gene_type:complete
MTNNRLTDIVTTKLITEKNLMEGQLEELLMKSDIGLEERVDSTIKKLKEISHVLTTLTLWESYNNNNLNKEND